MIHPAQWNKFIAEVNESFSKDRERIANLEQEIARLAAMLLAKAENEAPRRGRPPKEVETGV